jgi:hypothetical protein
MQNNNHPQTMSEVREKAKRVESKKAGKVQHKGGASTSHKETGGKMAR